MKSILENAEIDFKIALDSYKRITGFNSQQIAEQLGCSLETVRTMANNPLAVKGRWILPLLTRLKIVERERYQ